MKKIFLIFILFFLWLGCNGKKTEEEYSKEITFVTIGKGTLLGNFIEINDKSTMIIRSEENWQDLINQMDSYDIISDSFTETTIDFNTHIVVAIFGEAISSKSEIEITNIIEDESGLLGIQFSISSEDINNNIKTQPFHIVKCPF